VTGQFLLSDREVRPGVDLGCLRRAVKVVQHDEERDQVVAEHAVLVSQIDRVTRAIEAHPEAVGPEVVRFFGCQTARDIHDAGRRFEPKAALKVGDQGECRRSPLPELVGVPSGDHERNW
jgi:hypothetical protein